MAFRPSSALIYALAVLYVLEVLAQRGQGAQ